MRRISVFVTTLLFTATSLLHCLSDEPSAVNGTNDATTGGDGTTPEGDGGSVGNDGSAPDAPDGSAASDSAARWDGNVGPPPASTGNFQWNRILADGTNTSYYTTAVAAGWFGDVVVAARLDGSNASFGTPALAGPGFVVAKVSRDNKNVLWRQKFSGSVPISTSSVLVDEVDDVYVTGNVPAGQSAALGATTITGSHGFVAKLRGSDGQLQWAQEIVGTTASAYRLSSAFGKPVVLTGLFKGMLSYPLSPSGTLSKTGDASRSSALVMPLDRASGKALWGRTFLSSVSTAPAVDADIRANGDIELALGISGTITSDTGAFTTVSDVSVVLATLNATTGAHSAVASYLTTYMFNVSVGALPGGGVVAAGEKASTTTIMGGTSSSSQDVWVMGTNAAHAQQWAKWITGQYPAQTQDRREYLSCLDVDAWGRILVGVETASNGLVLDGVPVTGARTADATSTYMAVAKLAENGSTIWAKAINAGTASDVYPFDCRFALNGDSLFSAFVSANATPNFGGGALPANANNTAAVVSFTP
jgi:hypothetical protein